MMEEVLRRLWSKGKFKTLQIEDFEGGRAFQSDLGRNISEKLFSEGILYLHTISGVGKRRGVAVRKEFMPEVQSFLDNGILGARLKPVLDRLTKSWCK